MHSLLTINRKKLLYWSVLLIMAFLSFKEVAVFLDQRGNQPTQDKVAATIFPLYDIVRNIAGSEVETVLLLEPGTSPHTFDATPEDLKKVSGSRVVFTISHGIDDWAIGLAKSAGVREVITVDKKIPLLNAVAGDHADQGEDPHYWLTVPNALLIAGQVQDDLSRLFPDKASVFKNNYQGFSSELTKLDQELRVQLEGVTGCRISTFHNAWSYFAREYGLEIVTTFEEFPGKEPSPTYLAEFQKKIQEYEVKVIFSEPQFSILPLKPVADDLDVTISVLDPLGGVDERSSFAAMMKYNVSQIIDALRS